MKQIPVYPFYKHKYGEELLVDVISYDDMRARISRTPVFTETFHSITIVGEGDETVELNGHACRVAHGTVISSIPGEVWRFRGKPSMQALNLIFEKEFLLSFFSDAHFLDRFDYLSSTRASPFFHLTDDLYDRLITLYRAMQQEINTPERKDQHILRAMLYEALMLLSRAEMKVPEATTGRDDGRQSRYVERFVQLVEDHFTTETGTEFYAGQLCITPNYLGKIVRRVLRKSAKACILDRRMQEACRLLAYTTLSVQEIAEWLGYETNTYFVRSFRQHMGLTPLEYRRERDRSPEK